MDQKKWRKRGEQTSRLVEWEEREEGVGGWGGGGATRSFFVLLDIGVGYFGDYVFLFCFVSTTTSKWFTTSRVLDVTPVSFCIVFTCFVCLFVCFFLLFFASISRLLRRPHRRLRLRGRRWRRRRSRTRGDQGDDEIIGPATPTGCVTLCLERLHRCLFFFLKFFFLPSSCSSHLLHHPHHRLHRLFLFFLRVIAVLRLPLLRLPLLLLVSFSMASVC